MKCIMLVLMQCDCIDLVLCPSKRRHVQALYRNYRSHTRLRVHLLKDVGRFFKCKGLLLAKPANSVAQASLTQSWYRQDQEQASHNLGTDRTKSKPHTILVQTGLRAGFKTFY